MFDLSFCTTATIRPEVLEKTYESFTSHLTGVDFRSTTLHLNIDPAPSQSLSKRHEVIEVAKRYFGNVVVNCPDEPNFTSAVQWCWRSASTEYLFHLEDDWILVETFHVPDVLNMFGEKILQIVFRAYMKYNRFPLSPSILRRVMYQQVAPILSPAGNPEIQLRRQYGTVDLSFVAGQQIVIPDHPVVFDTGRAWASEAGVRRPAGKWDFIRWKESESHLRS